MEDLEKLKDRFSEDHEVEFYERRSSDVKITTIQFTTKQMLYQTRVSVNAKHTRNVMYDRTRAKNFGLFKEFLLALRPFKCHVWHKSNMLQRAKLLVRAPIVVICALYIPLVDYEMKKHGWNKLLNTLHIVLNPALSIMICSSKKINLLINAPLYFLSYQQLYWPPRVKGCGTLKYWMPTYMEPIPC